MPELFFVMYLIYGLCVICCCSTGIARMDGGDSGIVTTNVDASVSFAPVARLRTACEEVSSDIQDKDALVPRVEHLDAFAARLEASDLAAQEKLEMINQKKSRNISGEFSRSFTRRASVRGHGSKKTQDWTIDFNDLVLERVIGQGGFGTVYVGTCTIQYCQSLHLS